MSGMVLDVRKETHHGLAIFRTIRGFKRRRALSPTSLQSGFLRCHDSTILRSAEITERVSGYFSFPPRTFFGHLDFTGIEGRPEVGQPLEPFRAVFGESVVLGPSEPCGFNP